MIIRWDRLPCCCQSGLRVSCGWIATIFVSSPMGKLKLNDSCVLLGLGGPSCILTQVKMQDFELTAFDRLLGFGDARLG